MNNSLQEIFYINMQYSDPSITNNKNTNNKNPEVRQIKGNNYN